MAPVVCRPLSMTIICFGPFAFVSASFCAPSRIAPSVSTSLDFAYTFDSSIRCATTCRKSFLAPLHASGPSQSDDRWDVLTTDGLPDTLTMLKVSLLSRASCTHCRASETSDGFGMLLCAPTTMTRAPGSCGGGGGDEQAGTSPAHTAATVQVAARRSPMDRVIGGLLVMGREQS